MNVGERSDQAELAFTQPSALNRPRYVERRSFSFLLLLLSLSVLWRCACMNESLSLMVNRCLFVTVKRINNQSISTLKLCRREREKLVVVFETTIERFDCDQRWVPLASPEGKSFNLLRPIHCYPAFPSTLSTFHTWLSWLLAKHCALDCITAVFRPNFSRQIACRHEHDSAAFVSIVGPPRAQRIFPIDASCLLDDHQWRRLDETRLFSSIVGR